MTEYVALIKLRNQTSFVAHIWETDLEPEAALNDLVDQRLTGADRRQIDEVRIIDVAAMQQLPGDHA